MAQLVQMLDNEKQELANSIEFADAHCHLNLFENANRVVTECRKKGVGTIMATGGSGRDNAENAALASLDSVFAVIGISPDFSSSDAIFISEIEKLVKGSRKIVGIGEIGLDLRVVDRSGLEAQRSVFIEQVRIAKNLGLPVVIHSRGLMAEIVKVLDEERVKGAMFHFFDGDEKQAVELARKGHFISIPPTVSGKRKKVIKALDIRSIVVETDSPIVGKTPAEVIGICESIAKIKGISLEEVAARTTENIRRLFYI